MVLRNDSETALLTGDPGRERLLMIPWLSRNPSIFAAQNSIPRSVWKIMVRRQLIPAFPKADSPSSFISRPTFRLDITIPLPASADFTFLDP